MFWKISYEILDISFRALRTTSGKVTSSLDSAPRSCAPVRAPRITLVTAGASLTQARATSNGEKPNPSAATQTASTI